MRICFILNNYPTKNDPIDAFIRPIVSELAHRGHECFIVAPQSIVRIVLKKTKKRSTEWIDFFSDGTYATVLQPYCFSFSNIRIFGHSISCYFQNVATRRVIHRHKMIPDFFYGHFWTAGVIAGRLAQENNIPAIVVSGESSIDVGNKYSQKAIQKAIRGISGVVFVSEKNKKESIMNNLLTKNMINEIIPNGYSKHEFYPINKLEVRKKMGFSNDDKIAIFVGTFCNRKGVNRVIEAAKQIPSLKLILIGDGSVSNSNKQIVFKGRVSHDELITYLNSADFFILPTLAEGCCNAIIEALACGLPIISSNMDFNNEILDESCSIRIDPMSIQEIKKAMDLLVLNNELRKQMSLASLKKAEELTIEMRAKRIESFLLRIKTNI